MIRAERQADGWVTAVTEVVAGVDIRTVMVPLGSFEGELDPGGLRNTPVVVVDPEHASTVRRGAERSGSAEVVGLAAGTAPLGARLLGAAEGGEVVVVTSTGADAREPLLVARALGGRPLPAVPLDDLEAARLMLDGMWIDLDIAIPSIDGIPRDDVRARVEGLGLYRAHHVLEVDPRAAFEDAIGVEPLLALTAGAAGVLAGRLAAGNRGWR